LVRRGRKRKKDPYHTSFDRLSIYPKMTKPSEDTGRRLRPGDVIRVRLTGVDDEGRPLGTFQRYTVIVNGIERFEPGEIVQVRVVSVHGLTAMGQVVIRRE